MADGVLDGPVQACGWVLPSRVHNTGHNSIVALQQCVCMSLLSSSRGTGTCVMSQANKRICEHQFAPGMLDSALTVPSWADLLPGTVSTTHHTISINQHTSSLPAAPLCTCCCLCRPPSSASPSAPHSMCQPAAAQMPIQSSHSSTALKILKCRGMLWRQQRKLWMNWCPQQQTDSHRQRQTAGRELLSAQSCRHTQVLVIHHPHLHITSHAV